MSLPLPPAADDPFAPSLERELPFLSPTTPLGRSWLRRSWINVLFFLLTAAAVFLTGGLRELVGPDGVARIVVDWGDGFKLMSSAMAIMLAHEMGHYLLCRYYRVDATLPLFIPMPLLSFVGTLGAFIRIKSPFPNRRALFDIGIAGPLAGFAVCLPVLVLGVLEGHWAPTLNGGEGPGYFGEPLLFEWAVRWLQGPGPEGATFVIGPLGMAAWFGLFLTALNMMPVGQLDGGHVTHALWPRKAHWVSRAGLVACMVLLYRRPTWILWTLLLLLLGRRPHPPTLRDDLPIGRARQWIGLLGFAVFAVCFTPSPVLISWPQFLEMLGFTSR